LRSRLLRYPAVMISAHGGQCKAGKQIDRFARPQRPRSAIAQIDRVIDPATRDVGDYGFQCQDIAVHVSDDSQPHISRTFSVCRRVG
jgi:hypothetical protein